MRLLFLLLLIVTSEFPIHICANECHAILKIRSDENRVVYFAFDGNMANPEEAVCLTRYQSRIPLVEGYTKIFELCDSCCKSRAVNCYGYVTANWIDPDAVKPSVIFKAIGSSEVSSSDKQLPDCICLNYYDVSDEMNTQYNNLKTRVQTGQHTTEFLRLKDIVDHWEKFTSHFIK